MPAQLTIDPVSLLAIEFVAVADDKLATKPEGLSFVEAAALPTSGLAALHALRDVAKLQAGQSLLINGASGGIGTFAVQIAKAFGVDVTGVCSGTNAALVQSLGADHVVDYKQQDFTDAGRQYDCILDNVENRKLSEIRRALKPTGTLICNSGTGASGLAFWVRLLKPLIVSPFTTQRLCRYLSVPTRQDLEVLSEMVNAKKLKPVLSEVHTLDSVADALRTGSGTHGRKACCPCERGLNQGQCKWIDCWLRKLGCAQRLAITRQVVLDPFRAEVKID